MPMYRKSSANINRAILKPQWSTVDHSLPSTAPLIILGSETAFPQRVQQKDTLANNKERQTMKTSL